MPTARATEVIPAPVSAVEDVWYDTARWPSFIDGFKTVVRREGGWPEVGGSIVWDSTPAGRGRVVERATEYVVRRGQSAQIDDPRMKGTQRIAFEPAGDGARVQLSLEYELKGSAGPFRFLTDLLFIRRALRDSLRRTLARLSAEVEGDRALGVR